MRGRNDRWALVSVALMLVGCTRQPPPIAELPPPEVSVAQPVRREVLDHVVFTGNVEAVHEVEIKARVSGFVTAVHFTDGQAVSEGDLLFTIDERPFEIARDSATAEVAKQEAILAEQKSEVVRKEKLLPKGAVTQEEYEIAVAKRDANAAMLAAAKAQLAQAELDLSFCRVTSPVTGRISRRFVDVGELVSGTEASATRLTAVASIDPVYVVFEADERSVILARQRAAAKMADTEEQTVEWRNIKELAIPVDVQLVTDEGFSRRGVLDFVDIAVLAGTGTVRCRAVLENPERLLMPGMFVRARLPFGDPRSALLVPERAIGTDQGNKFVYVVDDNNRVAIRPVSLGFLSEGLRVIDAGLSEADRVITSGLTRVRPGITVRPDDA
ncbi:MAG: efflux RND transporter periplasmic adaptor subunit [Pirellulales bacterium]|nr:efflux RND transporter periplasmic adaptor subunit [Pirellulales bacterium]MBL7193338.1 efflux RND transporter periplasmic adaptor subunit [Pirellulales bacterium]